MKLTATLHDLTCWMILNFTLRRTLRRQILRSSHPAARRWIDRRFREHAPGCDPPAQHRTDKIETIHSGIDERFFDAKASSIVTVIGDPTCCSSAIEPRKNLEPSGR